MAVRTLARINHICLFSYRVLFGARFLVLHARAHVNAMSRRLWDVESLACERELRRQCFPIVCQLLCIFLIQHTHTILYDTAYRILNCLLRVRNNMLERSDSLDTAQTTRRREQTRRPSFIDIQVDTPDLRQHNDRSGRRRSRVSYLSDHKSTHTTTHKAHALSHRHQVDFIIKSEFVCDKNVSQVRRPRRGLRRHRADTRSF